VPTFGEAGVKDFVVIHWYGVLAPAGAPKEIVALLNREIAKALETAEIKERFAALALAPSANKPEDFRKLIENDVKRWKDVAAQTGVLLD
jgi:tripartite-type tricarboxylate transporter receptor subunit TctC